MKRQISVLFLLLVAAGMTINGVSAWKPLDTYSYGEPFEYIMWNNGL